MFRFFGRRFVPVILRDNGEGGGGGATNPPSTPAKETFSREYVHELREENKNTRLKLQEAITTATKAKEEAEALVMKIQGESDAKVAAANKTANDRIIRAELKAAALKEGLIDLDDLGLVDISSITVKEDGSLEGTEKVIADFKIAKPHKFGAVNTTTPDKQPTKPGGSDETPKKATEMTPEEYKKAKAEMLKK
jgi:hypothetical protein